MHENLHKNVNENSFHSHLNATLMSLYEVQLKQQTRYSFILLVSNIHGF